MKTIDTIIDDVAQDFSLTVDQIIENVALEYSAQQLAEFKQRLNDLKLKVVVNDFQEGFNASLDMALKVDPSPDPLKGEPTITHDICRLWSVQVKKEEPQKPE